MTIAIGTIIEASQYNTIQQKVSGVLNLGPGGYGVTSQTASVNDSTIIKAEHLRKLLEDFNKVLAHEFNTTATTSTILTTGTLIKADFFNFLDTSATIAIANTLTVHPNQQASTQVNQISTRTEVWTSAATINHKMTYYWEDQNHMRWFFNLGGGIKPHLEYNTSDGSANDIAWINAITAWEAGAAAGGTFYRSDLLSHLASGTPKVYSYSDGAGRSISLTYSILPSGSEQQINANLSLSTTDPTGINVVSTFTLYYSRGDTVPAGIAAPMPDIQGTEDFDGGYPAGSPFANRKLTVNPTSLTVNQVEGLESDKQTITLYNSSNTSITVTGIEFTANGVTPSSTASILLPIQLSPAEDSKFDVTYYGDTIGSFNNSIVIVSNNDRGNVTIPVTNNVVARVFDYTLTPSTTTTILNTLNTYRQKFFINTLYGSYTTYSATDNSAYFTLDNTALDGPVLEFNPTYVTSGTYTATVTVEITGTPTRTVTHSSTATVRFTAESSRNLGSWVSALGYYDSVVGMSYDFIGGKRYLTIGIGMGSDGVNDLNNGGIPFVNVDNLNYQSDPGYLDGPSLYVPIATGGTAWNSFLTSYGSWVNPLYSGPYNTLIQRTFTLTVTNAGYYTWKFAVDNTGYFDIDGGLVGDFQFTTAGYVTPQEGLIFLTAGDHRLDFYVNNTGGPGAIAIAIYEQASGNIFWTTRTPIRGNVSPYLYWSEVYRIPLESDGSPHTYYSFNYGVKNIGPVFGNGWSEYFGNGLAARSMFTVVDDGYGNLSVAMNTLREGSGDTGTTITLQNLSRALYYYTTVGQRYTQLEQPFNVSKTHLFTGFKQDGTVTTSVVDYPGYFDYATDCANCGDCGGGQDTGDATGDE